MRFVPRKHGLRWDWDGSMDRVGGRSGGCDSEHLAILFFFQTDGKKMQSYFLDLFP